MVAVHSARQERRTAGRKNDANTNRGFDMSTNIDLLDLTTPPSACGVMSCRMDEAA